MINEAELKKITPMLVGQAQKIANLISPRAALERGAPTPPEQIALATLDSLGLVCYAMALLITEVVGVLAPEAIERKDN